jgi:hypothetical protein
MAEDLSSFTATTKSITPHYDFLNSLLYADDTTIVAHSAKDLQALLDLLYKTCTRLQLTIDPAKTKVMIFHGTQADRDHAFHIGTNTISSVRSHKYLGFDITDTFDTHHMRTQRLAKASNMLHRATQFARNANLRHMQQLSALLAATVVQTALHGVELWGLFHLQDMDVLDNDIQELMARFLRGTLRLPDNTSTVILMLESGQKPAFTYCMRRAASFVHSCSTCPDKYLNAIVRDLQFMAKWNSHVKTLANRHAAIHNLPPIRMPTRANPDTIHTMPPSTVSTYLKPAYDHALTIYTNDTPHHTNARHRITSTYVQDIWNQRIANSQHARHPMYARLDIPYSRYRAWLKMRTLTLNLPAYAHHGVPSTCHLACNSRGDLKHWLMHCEDARREFMAHYPNVPLPVGDVRSFFNNRDDLDTLAEQVHGFCMLLKLAPTP